MTSKPAFKLVLGKAAIQSFPLRVEVPTPLGMAEINFEVKHMPSTEWAKLREEHAEAISDQVKSLFDNAKIEATRAYTLAAQNGPKVSVTDKEREDEIAKLIKPVPASALESLKNKHHGELISKIATKWDLDEPLSASSLAEMCDSYPGSADSFFRAYNETREGARLGN